MKTYKYCRATGQIVEIIPPTPPVSEDKLCKSCDGTGFGDSGNVCIGCLGKGTYPILPVERVSEDKMVDGKIPEKIDVEQCYTDTFGRDGGSIKKIAVAVNQIIDYLNLTPSHKADGK